jgi:hypothetical protein
MLLTLLRLTDAVSINIVIKESVEVLPSIIIALENGILWPSVLRP